MKLKQIPEDYKVEEISRLDIPKEKPAASGEAKETAGRQNYKLYLLEKKNAEQFTLRGYLSKKNSIPYSEFGFAGLKDRHAVTKQYFTIPSKYDIKTLAEQSFRITFLGYIDKPIKSGDLLGNKFEITARNIIKNQIENIKFGAECLKYGVPNYYDSQRFGSVIRGQFTAKSVLKKNYEEAVKIFMTQYTKSESKNMKDQKRFVLENWANISSLGIKKITNKIFIKIIEAYRKTGKWADAYKKIPFNLREMFVSAYQSYLWNECVKEVLKNAVESRKLYNIDYNAGSLLYYKNITDDEQKKIPKSFKTISHDIKPTEFEKKIIDKILAQENIELKDFDIRKDSENFFKVHERDVILKPVEFKILGPSADELNDLGRKNVFKMVLSFMLPKGSYATIVTKRVFGH